MAIEFHCEHCGRLVRTANEHAGKRGVCPQCHQSVYIPTPADELEPLRLAPVDESAERERRRLQEDAVRLAEMLRAEREVPPDVPKTGPLPEPLGDIRLDRDIETLVTDYVLTMASGKLNDAEELAREIHANMARAEEVIERLSMDEMTPPALAKVPRAVMCGFLKQLRK
jgi:hypothetical protein